MRVTQTTLPIYSIFYTKSKIDPKPQYQRGSVWTESQKQLLIDSILRGYDIPKIYLRELNNHPKYEFEVVDGQQRLRAIWDFMDNQYGLGEVSNDLYKDENISGRTFESLNSAIQNKIGGYTLSIAEIRNASEEDIRDLFLRLQEGKSLNPPEKRNAMTGEMRNFIADLSRHKIFSYVRKKNSRFLFDDWIAHVVALELANGPTNIKASDLKKLYEDNKNFDSNGKDAKKIKKVLNYMSKVLANNPPEMNVKWGFVDLYYLISFLMDNYSIKNLYKKLENFYVQFEKKRRKIKDPSLLITKGNSEWEKELYQYIVAFQKEGNIRDNITKRHLVYLRTFLRENPNLVPKDKKRLFNDNERIILWRNADGECEICSKKLKFNDMRADHIISHNKGGITSIENGQCLCVECNTKKSDK